jgi:hypothetical protein
MIRIRLASGRCPLMPMTGRSDDRKHRSPCRALLRRLVMRQRGALVTVVAVSHTLHWMRLQGGERRVAS